MTHDLEIAVSAVDRGPGRVREGDVVAVRPAGAGWGWAELKTRLIVPATGISLAEALALAEPLYACGKRAAGLAEGDDRTIEAKRRFRVPLDLLFAGWAPGVDLARLRNPGEAFQPLLDSGVVVDFSQRVAVCQDTHLGTFRYASRRTI